MQRLLYPFYYRSKSYSETPDALRLFAASLLLPSINRSCLFSGGGNAKKALLLTLSKQGFFLIQYSYYLIFSVFLSLGRLPIADVLSTILTGYFLRKEMTTKLIKTADEPL
jgi:hypothetical protein